MLRIQTDIDNLIDEVGKMMDSNQIDINLSQVVLDSVQALRWTHPEISKKLIKAILESNANN